MTSEASEPQTIFALSSAPGRAAVAVIRISGPSSRSALLALGVGSITPRKAQLRVLKHPQTGGPLDQALVLFFAGPASATGEDLAELQVHGGRAVVAAVLDALGTINGLQPAEPGAFARQAFANGKLDLTAAEGLIDLIDAETDMQRAQALAQTEGRLAQLYANWRSELITAMALVEAAIDFSDEGDVAADAMTRARTAAAELRQALASHLLDANRGEIIRDGFRVVLAGPPNAGKSSLINALAGRDVAIVSEEAGTTRDVIEVRLDLDGLAVVVSDTAGLRETESAVEREGIRRTQQRMREADLVVWLVDPSEARSVEVPSVDIASLTIATKSDLGPVTDIPGVDIAISSVTGEGLDALTSRIAVLAHEAASGTAGPPPTNARQRLHLNRAGDHLDAFLTQSANLPELAAEDLRLAASELGRLTGHVDPEDVLGAIFGRFCIGK